MLIHVLHEVDEPLAGNIVAYDDDEEFHVKDGGRENVVHIGISKKGQLGYRTIEKVRRTAPPFEDSLWPLAGSSHPICRRLRPHQYIEAL